MSTIRDRIEHLIKKEGLNAATFSLKINQLPQTTNKILLGKNKPGFNYLESILSTFPYVDARWLILGEQKKLDK